MHPRTPHGEVSAARHGVTRHEFTADHPNQVWLSDITEHWTDEGELSLCAVKDVCSGGIVGYSISDRIKSGLAVAALDSDVARRLAHGANVSGCIVHTDRGSQFRSRKFVHATNRHGLAGSMGRVGAVGDNVAMESFFALLQRTPSTAGPRTAGTNFGSRSLPGSNAPITGTAGRAGSDD